jgi:hypothetical protein
MLAVLGGVAMASIALMLAYHDDDDWKKREDWDRDNYWWFKVAGVAYRIPKPFEVGAIGTLAERGVELMVDDEMTGKRFRERLSFLVGQTFAFNPVPQLFKPMWDVYSNTDSFTGNPIESQSQEALSKTRRVNRNTSEFGRAASEGMALAARAIGGSDAALSPEQIDHMVKGYFGWLGTAILSTSTYALQSTVVDRPVKPAMSLKDVFLAGNFMESLPADRSRYVTQFYNQAEEINKAYADYRDMLKKGDKPAAERQLEKYNDEIKLQPKVAAIQRELSEINAAVRKVESSGMDADMKRTKLSILAAKRNAISERATRVVAQRLN